MAHSLTKSARMTVEEYLRLEADSLEKHEYRNGIVVAMNDDPVAASDGGPSDDDDRDGHTSTTAGRSPQHSLITANVIGELGRRLRGKSCRVYDSNLRLLVSRTTLYTYPDLSVICGKPQFDPGDRRRTTVTNPRVLVEVLSSSTEAYDRGAKFRQYLQIESLDEYILVSQNTPWVVSFFRQDDGAWLFTHAAGHSAVARIQSLAVDLPLAEVYAGVELPPEPPVPESGELRPF